MNDKLIDAFIETIRKEFREKYIFKDENKDTFEEYRDVYVDALHQGYLDACRTIKGASKVDDDKKREVLNKTAEEIKLYLQNGGDFKHKHNEWCNNLINEYYKTADIKITYGHAQKIINMAFKYLYCIYYKAEKLDKGMINKFKQCHMPLDSFSLEWFYRYYKKNNLKLEIKVGDKEINRELFGKDKSIKKDSISSWSSMKSIGDYDKEYPYEFYCRNIETYCNDNEIYPLKLDFIVWEKMQKIMAAEDFIKTFGGTPEKGVSYDWGKLDETLKTRLEEVKEIAFKIS